MVTELLVLFPWTCVVPWMKLLALCTQLNLEKEYSNLISTLDTVTLEVVGGEALDSLQIYEWERKE
jgi:hypothetical protein